MDNNVKWIVLYVDEGEPRLFQFEEYMEAWQRFVKLKYQGCFPALGIIENSNVRIIERTYNK